MKEGRGGHVILPNVRTLKFSTHMGGPARLPAVRQSLPHLLEVLLLVLLLGLGVRQLLGGGQTRRVKSIVLGVWGVCGRRL